MAKTFGVLCPAIRHLAVLDAFVLHAPVALARNFDERSVHDVAFAGDETLLLQAPGIGREEFVVELGTGELFAEFSDGVLVRDPVGLGDVEEVMETATVGNLILGLLVGQGKEGLQDENFEHEHGMKCGTTPGSLGFCHRDTL